MPASNFLLEATYKLLLEQEGHAVLNSLNKEGVKFAYIIFAFHIKHCSDDALAAYHDRGYFVPAFGLGCKFFKTSQVPFFILILTLIFSGFSVEPIFLLLSILGSLLKWQVGIRYWPLLAGFHFFNDLL